MELIKVVKRFKVLTALGMVKHGLEFLSECSRMAAEVVSVEPGEGGQRGVNHLLQLR
jgi:hypothetical protein